MRFTLAASAAGLLASSVLAAPRPQSTDEPAVDPPASETVTVTGLSGFVAADGKLETLSFRLATADEGDVGCANEEGQRPSVVSICGETKYRFGVAGGVYTESAVNVTIYHEKGPAWGFWGVGTIPVYCRTAGGDRRICNQPAESSVDVEIRF